MQHRKHTHWSLWQHYSVDLHITSIPHGGSRWCVSPHIVGGLKPLENTQIHSWQNRSVSIKKLDSKEICFAVMAVANRHPVHMTMNECHIYCPHWSGGAQWTVLRNSFCHKPPIHFVLSVAVNLHYKTNKNAIWFIVFRRWCADINAWFNLKTYMKKITSIFCHPHDPVGFCYFKTQILLIYKFATQKEGPLRWTFKFL